MIWQVLWPLILGFGLSAVVQVFVSRHSMARLLGDDSPRSITLATLFGIASSSCSYAAIALARSIFRKGASFTSAMVFEPAGSFFPSCVVGTARALKGTATIFSAPVQRPAAELQDSLPYVYVTRFTDGSATEPLIAELDLSYDEGPYGVARGTDTADFTLHA